MIQERRPRERNPLKDRKVHTNSKPFQFRYYRQAKLRTGILKFISYFEKHLLHFYVLTGIVSIFGIYHSHLCHPKFGHELGKSFLMFYFKKRNAKHHVPCYMYLPLISRSANSLSVCFVVHPSACEACRFLSFMFWSFIAPTLIYRFCL